VGMQSSVAAYQLVNMSTLDKAIQIASAAHLGQLDLGGEVYILHPIRVMQSVTTKDEKIVAILHDVIEDTDITLDYLKLEGFSIDIIEALEAITRVYKEPYQSYIKRVMKNPLALKVKVADLKDNLDMTRLIMVTEKDVKRAGKYVETYNHLKEMLK